MYFPILEKLEDTSVLQAQIRIIGQHRAKRQLEKRMKRHPFRINRRYPCRRQYDILLFRMCADVFQERGFTRSGLPGQKDGLARMGDQLQGILKLLIICI